MSMANSDWTVWHSRSQLNVTEFRFSSQVGNVLDCAYRPIKFPVAESVSADACAYLNTFEIPSFCIIKGRSSMPLAPSIARSATPDPH